MRVSPLIAIRIAVVMIDVYVDVTQVDIYAHGVTVAVHAWVVSVVVGRIPRAIARCPKPRIDGWGVVVHWINDIVCTINIRVAYNLHVCSFVAVAFHYNGGHVLKNIPFEHGLYHY